MAHIAVLGVGAWGEALALTLARAGQQVIAWGRKAEKVDALQQSALWQSFPGLRSSDRLDEVIQEASLSVFVLPAQTFRAFMAERPLPTPLLVASKGMEVSTGLLLSEIAEKFPHPLGFLGGPHLAPEVSQGLPTAGILASRHREWAKATAQLFQHPAFHLSVSSDEIGVQVAGALKNVLAIAGGIALGAGWGENARAALLTQGLQEMRQWGAALGATPETFWTQAGIGDFMLTCLSAHSRNSRFGMALGRGENPSPLTPLAEGFFTAQAVLKRTLSLGLHLPLMETLGRLFQDPACSASSFPQLLECLS